MNPTRLEPPHVAATAALLAEALGDDPAYCFLFGDPATRPRELARFFERHLRVHLPYRCTYVVTDGPAVRATVTLRPPGGIAISALTMLRRGILPFAAANGVAGVRRLLELRDTYDRLEADLARGRHWHVHMMAVAAGERGRGIGSALLARVLATTADAAAERLPTVLTTHSERNVAFYLRAGFGVADARDLAFTRAGAYHVWGMRRVHPSETTFEDERGTFSER